MKCDFMSIKNGVLTMLNFYEYFFLFVLFTIDQVHAGCYFPLEFQGEFLTQSLSSVEISYKSVSIFFDSIPGWGKCHKRLRSNKIILTDHGDDTDRSKCFRCITVQSRSRNVLQIFTQMATVTHPCYATESDAIQSCLPISDSPQHNQMMLYKIRGFYGESAITPIYCPLNGRFVFTYSINDGTENEMECQTHESQAGDCPSGYKFELKFRGCSFPNFDMSFQCLASWSGKDGETYLSLLDTKLPQLGEEARPRYRCAIYKKDPDTGLTHMALSSDSSCVNHLYSAQDGYETLRLEKVYDEPTTNIGSPQREKCRFPAWMKGTWQNLKFGTSSFEYRDETHYVTYKGNCFRQVNNEKYLIDVKTDCVDGGSRRRQRLCVRIKRRDFHVLEFQIGSVQSDEDEGDSCSDNKFNSKMPWLTVGRNLEVYDPPLVCPLAGEFTGKIPDTDDLCARLQADCVSPGDMLYTVFSCSNETEIFEQREYQCFGQWSEPGADSLKQPLVYTFTQRRDVPGYECFVGVTLSDDANMVTEAGSNCQRGHQPNLYGMKLTRKSRCPVKKLQQNHRAVSPRLLGSDVEADIQVWRQRIPFSPRILLPNGERSSNRDRFMRKRLEPFQHNNLFKKKKSEDDRGSGSGIDDEFESSDSNKLFSLKSIFLSCFFMLILKFFL